MMLVSICIPCYNAAAFLPNTLTALLHQTHQELEIIVVDDHSSDESLNILAEFAAKDNRISFEIAEKKGAAAARNQAYRKCKGEYIVFFDADDWIPENFIETQCSHLKTDDEVVVAKWGRFYENNLETIAISPTQIQKDLSFEDWVLHYWIDVSHMTCPGRVMIPKKRIEKSGLWEEDLSLNDDFSFYTKVFAQATIIRYNAESLFYYRSGIGGLSAKKGNTAYQSLYQATIRSIATAEKRLKPTNDLKLCYANLLQHFIYESYPLQPELIAAANRQIQALGGASLAFSIAGKTKTLVNLLGWKLVKRIKNLIS